jgi:hypothetical protein
MAITRTIIATDTPTASVINTWLGNTQDERVVSGFLVEDDTGIYVTVSAGTALIKDGDELYQVVSTEEETLLLADDNTNYVYLHCDNGEDWLTYSTSAEIPADAILLATVVTTSGDITSVTDNREIGKQTKVYSMLGKTYWDGGTYNNYIHLNPSFSKYIRIKKIKYIVNMATSTPYAYCYYNLGSGEVQLDAYRCYPAWVSSERDLTPNVTSTDKTADVYVRLYLSHYSGRLNITSIRIYVEEWS